jgi:CBS domain-containing protein
MAGLVGMAAIFAGASHALLTSIVFAFETTDQLAGLLPLLVGCTAAYLVSLLINRHSIMTEKLARRGVSVRAEYSVDHLSHVVVRDAATTDVVTLAAAAKLGAVRAWIRAGASGTTHQGFPVTDEEGKLVGVVTRRDILDALEADDATVASVLKSPAVVVYEDSTLRDAADQMVLEQVGRLPVVQREHPRVIVGIVSRSDLLSAHENRLDAEHRVHRLRSFEFLEH